MVLRKFLILYTEVASRTTDLHGRLVALVTDVSGMGQQT
jgi:hypothetical protein